MLQIAQKKCLWLKKVKNTVPETYLIGNFNSEETIGTFLRKRITKIKSKRVTRVIKKKDNKLYVGWKSYNSSFNSWTDKKDII